MGSSIKGATIINTLSIVRDLMGSDGAQAIIASCPRETQQLLRRTLMAVEWIDVDVWSPFLSAILERVAGRDEVKYRRIMRAVCKRDFSGLYRVYLQNADPYKLLEKVQSIWSAYFDSGTLSASALEPKNGLQQSLLELRGLESTAPIYLVTLHAYMEQLLIMVGAVKSSVQRRRESHLDGRLSCDFLVTLG
jgi:hypothetical protein